MNERFLELAIKAREYAETKPHIYRVAYDKKFAELIIRECAHVAWLNSTEDNVAHIKIKEHFGIK